MLRCEYPWVFWVCYPEVGFVFGPGCCRLDRCLRAFHLRRREGRFPRRPEFCDAETAIKQVEGTNEKREEQQRLREPWSTSAGTVGVIPSPVTLVTANMADFFFYYLVFVVFFWHECNLILFLFFSLLLIIFFYKYFFSLC